MAVPLAPLGLLALGFLVFSGDDEQAPATKPPEMTPEALDAITTIRVVNGSLVRFFKPEIVNVVITMFNDSGLAPIAAPPTMPHGAAFTVLSGQPKPVNAATATMQAANTGLVVLGTLRLPFPQRTDRHIVIGQPGLMASAHPSTDFAVLIWGPPGTPLPGNPPKGGGGGGTVVPPFTTPPEIKGDELDANLPAELRAQVQTMLASTTIDPWALEDAADAMEAKYPKTAGALRRRAGERRDAIALRDTQRGYSEHTIRSGDLASKLAAYYTGDGARWKEIPKVNQHRNMKVVTINNVTQLTPWSGVVRLPSSWQTWAKRPAPVATGSLPSAPKTKPAPKKEPPPEVPWDEIAWANMGLPPPDAGEEEQPRATVTFPPAVIHPSKV